MSKWLVCYRLYEDVSLKSSVDKFPWSRVLEAASKVASTLLALDTSISFYVVAFYAIPYWQAQASTTV